MSDNFFDKFIADLVKGAEASQGFMPGSKVNVEISREHRGREEKLASFGGALGGGLLGGGAGALGGGLAGAGTGALLGKLLHLDPAVAQDMGALLGVGGAAAGGLGGAAAGTAAGMEPHRPSLMERMKGGALESRYTDGIKAAAAAFGIKEAFLPALLGAAAPMLGRSLLGKAAPAIAGRVGSGLAGAAFDTAAQAGGQAIGNKLMPPKPPMPN
jgi:hypothetical protein